MIKKLKVLYVLCNVLWNFTIFVFKLHGYFSDRVRCGALSFVRLVTNIFAKFINTEITVMFIHSFIFMCIRIFFLLLVFVILLTCSLLLFVYFKISHTRFISKFRFSLIYWCNFLLNCVVDVFIVDNARLNYFVTQ